MYATVLEKNTLSLSTEPYEMVPRVGSYIRASSFRKVDFPVPDLPMIPT